MPEKPSSGIKLDLVTKLLTVLSLAIGLFAAYTALPVDREIKSLQAQASRHEIAIKQADADLKTLESGRKITLELYQEVKKVIEKKEKDSREEEAVRVLVESLADDPFRWKLLKVIAIGAKSTEVKEKASNNSNFYEEDAVLKEQITKAAIAPVKSETTSKGVGAYNVDVFYCEAKRATSEPLARSVLQLRGKGDTGRWRVRLLPSEINAQPGYAISTNQIRFTPPEERQAAEAISRGLSAKGMRFELHETSYPTPNYVSVFICQ